MSSVEQTQQSTKQRGGKGMPRPRHFQREASPQPVVMEVVRSRTMSFRLFNLTLLFIQIGIESNSEAEEELSVPKAGQSHWDPSASQGHLSQA